MNFAEAVEVMLRGGRVTRLLPGWDRFSMGFDDGGFFYDNLGGEPLLHREDFTANDWIEVASE